MCRECVRREDVVKGKVHERSLGGMGDDGKHMREKCINKRSRRGKGM